MLKYLKFDIKIMEIHRIELIISFILLLFSALFSFSETCLTVCNQNKIHREVEKKNSRAKLVLNLLFHKNRLISTILFVNTLFNVLISAILTNEALQYFGEKYLILTSIAMTAIILIFAEVLPKTLALVNPEKSSMMVAPIINFSVRIFYPITFILQVIVNFLFKILGVSIKDKENSLIGDIKDLVAVYKENIAEKESLKMINGISLLNDIKVSQIMVHRSSVIIVDIDRGTIEEIINNISNSHRSRIPIYRNNSDNILGILHIKDLSRELLKNNNKITKERLIEICQKPLFVYEHSPLSLQLNRFRLEHKHFAIVIDEYSVFLGIITLEDIIEEIVGSISDEYDKGEFANNNYIKQQGDWYLINCDISFHELIHSKLKNLNFSNYKDDYSTFAGFIIEKIERIPEEGEEIIIDNHIFKIVKMKNNKIISVLIKSNGQ